MSKFDIPQDLREFWRLFEQFARRNSYSKCFRDLLVIILSQFCPPPHMAEDWESAISDYNDRERALLKPLMQELMLCYQSRIDFFGWCDPLGDLYMMIVSRFQASGMGQFFTPIDLCDMIAQMQIEGIQKGARINDPTCGSARMLLAAHKHSGFEFTNRYYGQDLDYICCIMSCLNMCIHGMQGEIVHHNSLAMNFFRAWQINPFPGRYGNIPHLITIEQDSSFVMNMLERKEPEEEAKPRKEEQLTIFSLM